VDARRRPSEALASDLAHIQSSSSTPGAPAATILLTREFPQTTVIEPTLDLTRRRKPLTFTRIMVAAAVSARRGCCKTPNRRAVQNWTFKGFSAPERVTVDEGRVVLYASRTEGSETHGTT
jgi:hypothetical protein